MTSSYAGPLREEPLSVELHNTIYAVRGEIVDGLGTADDLESWLTAVADRLPMRARGAEASRQPEFLALRSAVRKVLRAALVDDPMPAAALEAVNAAAALAPVSPVAVVRDGRVRAETRHHTADATDVALATLAADAIGVLTGPARERLRTCGAPGCVLMFLKEHPRRTWCSEACGNRARQARHYKRTRGSGSPPR